MNKKPVLWIIIPCYNEQEVLPVTAPMFLEKLLFLTQSGRVSEDSRILFVNDGSKDKTWEIIRDLAAKDPHFMGISQSRNRGHQNALVAGMMEAKDRCDITITIDCDGQDDLNAMDEMVDAYLGGCEIVYGVRSDRDTDTWFKRTTAQGYYKVLGGLGADVVYNHADYRLVSSRVLREFANFKEVNLYLRGMFQHQTDPPDHGDGRHRRTDQFCRCPLVADRSHYGRNGGRLGQHDLHHLLPGRDSAPEPWRHRRICGEDISGNETAAPLHHQREDLGEAGKRVLRRA